MVTAEDILDVLLSFEDGEQQKVLTRFFKCGQGQYGYGDKFIGVRVPQTRSVAKSAKCQVPFDEIEKLLYSPWHEVRLCGFLLLVEEMKEVMPKGRSSLQTNGALRRQEIAEFYLKHAFCANNWDLVDLSCIYILGPWLLLPEQNGGRHSRGVLYKLAGSSNLWEQRMSVVTTLAFIRNGEFDDALQISMLLLSHPHDLIHKAVGWVLREVGKRDLDVLRSFLNENYCRMSRTSLRYAIEKMSDSERHYWLKRK
ncbi:DNA alkylation repair protein [uncultured Muribaculum sp.]|uniref:DNA alkylation repair protein n=1 Tax=uncultured Muribaculum sp. TaxID=1918613 RepID=UPI0026E0ACDD|nr:DNA alkylation repair protein [uncultured Muribaculum sp.]